MIKCKCSYKTEKGELVHSPSCPVMNEEFKKLLQERAQWAKEYSRLRDKLLKGK